MATHRNEIESLVNHLKDQYLIRNKTEAQAIALASTKPSAVFYTSDTHSIVVGGNVYGRGAEMASAFKYASSAQDTSNWDTNYLYIVPESQQNYNIYAYTSSSWVVVGTERMDISQDAVDINYDATNSQLDADNVQDAIDEVVEDVFGVKGRWADCVEEGIGTVGVCNNSIALAGGSSNYGNTQSGSYAKTMFFKCEAGDKFYVQGLYRQYSTTDSSKIIPWAFYDRVPDTISTTTNTFHSYVIDYATRPSSSSDTTTNYTDTLIAPTGAKMLAVNFYTNNIRNGGFVKKWVQDPVSIVDEKGRLIDGWNNDILIPNDYTTEYNIGDTIGYWLVNKAYGCRGKRLPVKEGDKLLLDTFSPMRCGLYFTDEELVIVSKYEDRRYDGVYTAPCDGYAYIIDVLYRDNWIYEGALANLAYVAYDARKNTTFDNDYYNEFAPYSRMGFLPKEVYDKPPASTSTAVLSVSESTLTSDLLHDDKYVLLAVHIIIGENNQQTAGAMTIGSSTHLTSTASAGTRIFYNELSITSLNTAGSKGAWVYEVVKNLDVVDTYYRVRLIRNASMDISKYLHFTVDKIFSHSFSDINEVKRVATAIGNDELNPTQYGLIESTTSPWMQAMGTASALGLGYDIFEKGAELPMDNTGFAYGVTLKGTAGKAFGSSTESNADQDLVYLPVIDWSNYTGTKTDAFNYCRNLMTIPDIEWSSSLVISNSFFANCNALKKIGNLTPAKVNPYQLFLNCWALESVGNMETNATPSFYRIFYFCYDLKSIGTITWGGGVNNCNGTFQNCLVLENFPSEIPLASNCTTMYNMFSNCKKLVNAKVPTFTYNGSPTNATANITIMTSMFYGCNSLTTTVDLDRTSVTDADNMYAQCMGLLTAGNLNLPACTNAINIFSWCKNLTTVGNISIPVATTTLEMFYYCNKLTTISSLTMSSTNKNMTRMFMYCYALTELPAMDTSGVTNWTDCFRQCTSLVKITSIDFSSITTPGSYLFYMDTALKEMLITNLGKSSGLDTYDFTALTNWGNDDGGDGYDSLIDSVVVRLYDRSSGTKGVLKFSTNTYNLLSASHKTTITGKNYDIYQGSTKKDSANPS